MYGSIEINKFDVFNMFDRRILSNYRLYTMSGTKVMFHQNRYNLSKLGFNWCHRMLSLVRYINSIATEFCWGGMAGNIEGRWNGGLLFVTLKEMVIDSWQSG